MDNCVWMTGNVATPPNFRSGENAQGHRWTRAEFRLACTRRGRRADGEWVDVGRTFVTVVAWRGLAEGLLGSIAKGDPIVVVGRLSTDEWVNRDGEPQSRLILAAETIGHDLSRGRARFAKNPAAPGASDEADRPAGATEEDDRLAGEGVPDELDGADYVTIDDLDALGVG